MENKKNLPTVELYEAIRTGDLKLAQKAISDGADLTSILHGLSYTPVGWATFKGLPEILEALVNAGAPVPTNALEPFGVEEMTDWIIQSDKENDTYARVAQILITHGASPNLNAYNGKPLIESFPLTHYPNIHRVLCEALTHSKCTHAIEQASELDASVIDGNQIRGSWSICAAKIRLNPFRYLWWKFETRPFFLAWLVLAPIIVLSFGLHCWILGIVLSILFLPLSYLLFWIYRRVAEIYYNAALTAGIVVSQNPLEFISMANMDSGFGESVYAVKRVSIRRLPCHPEVVGTHFPCGSGFQDGPTPMRWGDFEPHPLSHGTGNLKIIQARKDKLGNHAFDQLQKIYELGKFPKKSGELVWINEEQP